MKWWEPDAIILDFLILSFMPAIALPSFTLKFAKRADFILFYIFNINLFILIVG